MSVTADNPTTAVLHVGGLHYASEKAVVEGVLARRPGVIKAEANPVAQTATVTFDADRTRGTGPPGRSRAVRMAPLLRSA